MERNFAKEPRSGGRHNHELGDSELVQQAGHVRAVTAAGLRTIRRLSATCKTNAATKLGNDAPSHGAMPGTPNVGTPEIVRYTAMPTSQTAMPIQLTVDRLRSGRRRSSGA